MAHILSMTYTATPVVKPVLSVTFLPEEHHTSQQLDACLTQMEETLREAWNLPKPKQAARPAPKPDPKPGQESETDSAHTRAAPKAEPKTPPAAQRKK